MSNKPYSLGFKGHAKSCDCDDCATHRAEKTMELWTANGAYAVPKSVSATIFVRSYFRKSPNHLNKMPTSRKVMRDLIRSIQAKARR